MHKIINRLGVLEILRKVARDITDLIGETPLLRFEYTDPAAILLCKTENCNPTGTLKDRVAFRFLEEKSRGSVVTAATSGALGVSLAAVGAALGIRVILCQPDRGKGTDAENYGAEIRLTDPKRGMKGALVAAKSIADETGGIFFNQFEDENCVLAHRDGTGTEIWEQSEGKADILICGVGSGGTITGVGELLRAKNPAVKIIAVEPLESAVLSGGKPCAHEINGLGAGFIPKILKCDLIDEIITVSLEKADGAKKAAALTNGLKIGTSSGAVLAAALEVSRLEINKGKTVIAVLPC